VIRRLQGRRPRLQQQLGKHSSPWGRRAG